MLQLTPEGAFAVLAKAQELERQGKSIIHLEIGQPDFPTPAHIVEAGINALKEGKTKYCPSLGLYSFREALAKQITENTDIQTNLNNIVITPGCKNAIFAALAAIIEQGDEVLYPDPGFPAYKNIIEFFGGKPIPIPMIEERDFSFDMDILRKHFSPKTKAIILNFPSNPTGTILSRKDMETIAELVKGTQTWIVSDEIYARILYAKEPYVSMYSLPYMKERTIIVDGFSKTYAMTGWRLGYAVVPENLIERFDYLLVNSVSCTAPFTQEAGLQAIIGSQDSVRTMVSEFKTRRNFVIGELNKIPGIRCKMPQGAFYAFCNITAFNMSSQKLATYLLTKAEVALLDGTSFGQYGEGYLRISYATGMDKLREALKRIKYALAKLPH